VPSAADLSFDAASAVRPTPDPTVFAADVHPLWTVGDKPNGGYLLALMGRAARDVMRAGTHGGGGGAEWDVVSGSITYALPPELAPATVRTSVLRRGRSAAQVRAVLVQDGRDMVDAVFVVSTVPPSSAIRYDGNTPLDVPEPDACERLAPDIPGGLRVGLMDVLDLRLDPATNPFAGAAHEGAKAELRGWTRFVDGREPDALSLLFSIDAVPPATLMIGSSGWVPTLQMSAYVRAGPEPGWLGLRFTANLVAGGMVDETCVLWDSSGRVVGQSTQLARLRFPDEVG
jgi:acyl-Coa thioesterase superfamily protein/acyl-CoA thioesterase superfamily protein